MAAIKLYGRRPKLRKTTSYSQQRASQLDSFDGEVEGDEAETMVLFDLLRSASVDGDAAASSARSRPWRLTERERERGSRGGKKVRGESKGRASACSYPRGGGGTGREARGWRGRRGTAAWRQCPLSPQ